MPTLAVCLGRLACDGKAIVALWRAAFEWFDGVSWETFLALKGTTDR